MNIPNGKKRQFTPENTKAWTLALYPALVVLGIAYMIIAEKPITTEIVGLFVGLLTAGTLQAAIKKNGASNAESNDTGPSSSRIRYTSAKELEKDDRRWPDDSDSGSHYSRIVRFCKMDWLLSADSRIRHLYR